MTLPPERTEWNDARLEAEFLRVYKQINGTPAKMVRMEEAMKALSNVVQDLRVDHEQDMRAITEEIKSQRKPGWTRTEKISVGAVVVALLGVAASGAAVIF
jgi:hypothetical protein